MTEPSTGHPRGVPESADIGSSPKSLLCDMALEERALSGLVGPPNQRRSYGLNEIIAAGIDIAKDGFGQPVVIRRNGRPFPGSDLLIDAARWLDLETVPCLIIPDFGAGWQRCLQQALEQLGNRKNWDLEVLTALFEQLVLADGQAALAGFPPLDLDHLIEQQFEQFDRSRTQHPDPVSGS